MIENHQDNFYVFSSKRMSRRVEANEVKNCSYIQIILCNKKLRNNGYFLPAQQNYLLFVLEW